VRNFDYTAATEFLSLFYEGTEHAVEFRALPNITGEFRPISRPTRDPQIVHDLCEAYDGAGRGIFFGVCTRINGRHSGKREDLAELPGLWVDIDYYKLGITLEEALAALRLCPLVPTIIISSGGGLHVYWLFREPMDVRLTDGPDTIKEDVDGALRCLAGVFAGDINSCDITRVLRLIGTHNTKDGSHRLVTVLEASWVRHEFDDLVEMLDQLRPLLRAPESAARTVEAVPDNPWTEFGKRFSFNVGIDVEQRLAAMSYEAEGANGVNVTQRDVSSSMVSRGADDETIVARILEATYRAAGIYGPKWNWKREERKIRILISDWRKKIAKTDANKPAEQRQSATVIQLRGGSAQEAPSEDETRDPAPKLLGAPLNDIGNAVRLIDHHGAALRYVVGLGWHVWDTRRYKVDPGTIDARKLCHETVRNMLLQAFDIRANTEKQGKTREAIIKFAISSGNTNKITGMLAQAEPHLAAESDDLDKDPMLLNCLNGTVDLKSGALRPHVQSDLLTKICGAGYDPTAECPIWERFVSEIFDGDGELVAFVQRAIGYSITGLTSEQVVFILHGSGSNGKSVLIETIAAVLADYVKRSPAETWISKPNNGPSNDIAALAGARFVSVVETEHEKQLAEALVKQATGGDAMTARFHYKEFFSFIPKFKLWLATNHKPRIRGSDFAIWRRILLLPFNVTFVDADKRMEGQMIKDPDLKNKLSDEFPGILAWMVRGCMAWQEIGLRPPAAVVSATESYQDSQDNVSGFIRDNCHLSRGLSCSIGLLYASYEIWCSENDEEAIPKRTFGKNLDERGYPSGQRSDKARLRKGIDLTQECRDLANERLSDSKEES
jgi:putative DNA primase/helicase